jgi:hypothetical protein
MNKITTKLTAEISNKEFSEIFDKIKNEQNVDKLKSIFINELPIVLNERLECDPELNKFGFLKNIIIIKYDFNDETKDCFLITFLFVEFYELENDKIVPCYSDLYPDTQKYKEITKEKITYVLQ